MGLILDFNPGTMGPNMSASLGIKQNSSQEGPANWGCSPIFTFLFSTPLPGPLNRCGSYITRRGGGKQPGLQIQSEQSFNSTSLQQAYTAELRGRGSGE